MWKAIVTECEGHDVGVVRAVIADDDPGSALVLRMAIDATGRACVVRQAGDGMDCLGALRDERPDVLFLDIQLPKLTGIEVAEQALREPDAPLVVFVTNHDSYAVRAFELAAVDYIVKDAQVDRFERRVAAAVDRVVDALKSRGRSTPVGRAAQHPAKQGVSSGQDSARAAVDLLVVKDYGQGTIRLIDPADVLYVRRRGRRSEVSTATDVYPTYHALGDLLDRLQCHGFVRASRSALLSLRHVEHLIPNGDGSYDAIMRGKADEPVGVSRACARALLGAYAV
jgi:DNA-binding LytR/AlgR family response regulator